MRSLHWQVASALLVVAGGAGTLAQADGGDVPYVYTNADLAAYEALPVQHAPLSEHPLDWNDIQDFIAAHHDRLAVERQNQLERALAEQAIDDYAVPRTSLALAPWWYPSPGKSRAQRIWETRHTDFANRIVPLHARTPLIAPSGPVPIRGGCAAIPPRPHTPRGGGRHITPRPASGSARASFPTAVER